MEKCGKCGPHISTATRLAFRFPSGTILLNEHYLMGVTHMPEENTIETERLLLRRYCAADLQDLYALLNKEKLPPS